MMNIPQLLNAAMNDPDEDVREAAVCDLIQADASEVMAAVRELAVSPDDDTRYLACWLCAELGHPEQPFVDERRAILKALSESDGSSSVRYRAVRSLGLLSPDTAAQDLERFAADTDTAVRLAVAQSLSPSTGVMAERILSTLAGDDDEEVREWAVFSLGQSRRSLSHDSMTAIRSCLKDWCRTVRLEAIRALVFQGDNAGVEALVQELESQGIEEPLWDAVRELSLRSQAPLHDQ